MPVFRPGDPGYPPDYAPGLTVEPFGTIGVTVEDYNRYIKWRNEWLAANQSGGTGQPSQASGGVDYSQPHFCGMYGTQGPVAEGYPPIHKIRIDSQGVYSGLPAGVSMEWLEQYTTIRELRPGDVPCIRANAPLPPSDSTPPDERECCSEGELCDGLTDILNAIVDTQRQIAEAIANEFGSCDQLISKCRTELEELIASKVEQELRTYTDCQNKIRNGLCGTVEFEQQCAKYALTCAKDECSMAEGGYSGKPCEGCGKDPCCCKDNVCVPCDEEKPSDERYKGWCNPITGVVTVTQGDEPPTDPQAVQVAITDTEIAAIEVAKQYCKQQRIPDSGPTGPTDIPSTQATYNCYLGGYRDGANANQLKIALDRNALYAGMARVNKSIGDIGIAGLTIDDFGEVAGGIMQAVFGARPLMLDAYVPLLTNMVGCNSQLMNDVIVGYSTFGLVQSMTGADLSQFATPYEYAINSLCRNRFLDPEKAMAAFLSNAISADDLDTQWAIAGFCPESVEWFKETARAKPIPMELATMKMRGLISESEYYAGMRKVGYTNQADSYNLLQLRQQLPGLSDIIRFMVRDADDEGLVKQFKLDDQFAEKYRKQLKEWSEQQGISEQIARYAWRSHWAIPSPTQLFQFWRRLRKDAKFGGEVKLWEDISAALVQQDILPFWHEHYKAINYVPLGRVDIRRMFNTGSVPESDLEGLYQQLGYSDDDAARQKKFAIRERDASIGRHKLVKLWTEGLWTRRQVEAELVKLGYPQDSVDHALDIAQYQFDTSAIAAAFTSGLLNRQQFITELVGYGVHHGAAAVIADKIAYRVKPGPALRKYQAGMIDNVTAYNELIADGMNTNIVQRVLGEADANEEISNVVACQRAIKRRYVSGDVDKLGAENALTKAGTNQQRAAKMVNAWECELATRGKDASIPKLCEWLARGAIGPQDFLRRTQNLGYDQADAALIMEDCLISVNAKRTAEAKRQAKEDAAADASRQRKVDKANAAARQAAATLERARQKAASTTARRQKQLLSAVEKIVKKCNCTLADAHAFALAANARIPGEFGLDKDETLEAILTGVDNWQSGRLDDLTESINLAADLLQVVEDQLGNGLPPSSPNTNGQTVPS